MNKKLKLALATLLGFSAACSTVRNAPAKGEGEQRQEAGAPEVRDSVAPPRVMVMYGVRPPGQKTIGVPLKESAVGPAEDEQLDPVAEKPADVLQDVRALNENPADDTPYMDTKGKKAPEGGK